MAALEVEALVLAGSGQGEEEYRPLKTVGGRPMLAYVLDALRNCPAVRRLAVAGPADHLAGFCPEGVELVAGGANLMETVQNGLAGFQPRGWLLVVTADVPFLTSAIVEDFLNRCELLIDRYNFFYSVVRKEVYDQRYPGGRRTYVHLRDGSYTGGNIFLVRPEIVIPACRRGMDIMRLRKSPLGLARLIGPWFLLRYLCRRLSLAEAERRFSALLGLNGITVALPDAAVGFDLDRPEDFALAEQIFQGAL